MRRRCLTSSERGARRLAVQPSQGGLRACRAGGRGFSRRARGVLGQHVIDFRGGGSLPMGRLAGVVGLLGGAVQDSKEALLGHVRSGRRLSSVSALSFVWPLCKPKHLFFTRSASEYVLAMLYRPWIWVSWCAIQAQHKGRLAVCLASLFSVRQSRSLRWARMGPRVCTYLRALSASGWPHFASLSAASAARRVLRGTRALLRPAAVRRNVQRALLSG